MAKWIWRSRGRTPEPITPAVAPGPDRLLSSDRIQECVAATLNELSQQERTAFVLRHFEGQSIDEISSALGVSGNAAKHSYLSRGAEAAARAGPLVNIQAMNHLNDEQFVLVLLRRSRRAASRIISARANPAASRIRICSAC